MKVQMYISCGVRQGGLSSPYLTSVLMDWSKSWAAVMLAVILEEEVSIILNKRVIRWCSALRSGVWENWFVSLKTMQNYMVWFIILRKEFSWFSSMYKYEPNFVPDVCINWSKLVRVDKFCYLGYIVNIYNLSDNDEIERERNAWCPDARSRYKTMS